MSYKKSFLVLLVILSKASVAQYSYTIDQTIPVEIDGKSISMPWAGGVNSAQINTMDLNGDAQNDLVIFERTANKILTYLAKENKYQYAPEFENQFPSAVDQWMLLRDYNGDGKKDLFTSDPFGIKVFVNVTQKGQKLSWRPYNKGNPLLTVGFSGNINLQLNGSDIPAIDDVDGDGDLDILAARFVGIGSLEWHKNLSIENTGKTDSLYLKRVTQNWGNFEECDCAKFIFGPATTCASGGRISHAAGKSLLTVDLDNDGDKELFFSEENCSSLYLLTNQGTKSDALMTASTSFPTSSPLNFDIFPAAYYEDVTFDGVPDVIASSNIYSRTTFATSFNKTMWLYKNTGTTQQPVFTLVKNNFLQDQMIDVGDSAVPAFFDLDNDEDLDMVIGSFGNEPSTSFYFFENVGTTKDPSFKLITSDYLNLSNQYKENYNYKPQFADIDGDGTIDFVFTATSKTDGLTTLYYVKNKSTSGFNVESQSLISTKVTIGLNENILVTDVEQDGLTDILIGTSTGAVEYWINNGPRGSFNYSLKNSSYLGLGISTDRQNLSLSTGDLNNDGQEELIVGNQRGITTIYENYRTAKQPVSGNTQIVIDPLSGFLAERKLSGRIWPVAANLFFKKYPSLVVGTITGGVILLKNEDTLELPPTTEVSVYPNPVSQKELLMVKADRNMSVQIFSVVGQKLTDSFSILANQAYPYAIDNIAPGVYIATFTASNQKIFKKFIIH